MKTLRARTPEGVDLALQQLYQDAKAYLEDPSNKEKGVSITLRSMDWITHQQMKLVGVICGEIASQITWHGQKLSKDDVRHMGVAALRKDQRLITAIDGGVILLGGSSRELNRKECGELIELLYSWGAREGVVFKDHKEQKS